jgi:hypothetical protein
MPSPLLLQFMARALSLPVVLIGLYLVLQVAALTRLAVTVLGGTGIVGIGFAFREIAEDELGASTVNIWVQLWLDRKSYSISKVRSALMRQIKQALQTAEISMLDAAREIIFPNGVLVRHAPLHETDAAGPPSGGENLLGAPDDTDGKA